MHDTMPRLCSAPAAVLLWKAIVRCPFCTNEETRVVDTRLAEDGQQIRRRRECPSCGARFSTVEMVEIKPPMIIKRDGRREPFSEPKLRQGVERALEKRPVSAERIDRMIGEVSRRVRTSGEREVDSRQLGEWTMQALRALDPVAYVRFASVYRRFEDVSDFVEAIQQVEKQPPVELKARQLSLLGEPEGDLTPSTRTRKR